LQGKSFKEIRNLLLKIIVEIKDKGEVFSNNFLLSRLIDIEKDRRALGEKAVRIPEVKWADVGGLADAKDDILQTIMLPIEKPHLFKSKMFMC
jgi:SpoVK/Ycf46/Vps4 family AAA+-type ATPase